MPVAGVAENVTVNASETSAEVSTDIAQNQSGNVVDSNALDRLKVFDQDYITTMITYFPANSYDPEADWSRSDNDQRHKFDMLASEEAGKWFNFGTGLSVYSGKPVNITTGNDDNRDGLAIDRPQDVPRNRMHGPAYLGLDLNVGHEFPFTKDGTKGPTASVSINSFNVLNHPNDMTYFGVIGSPFFRHAVAAEPPRRMQLQIEFRF